MATRRQPWESLSPSYRERLSRKGITPGMHAAGESIRAARGHERTPEHPREGQTQPVQFPQWMQTRRSLVRQVNVRKDSIWGSSHKYRSRGARKVTNEGVNGNPPSNAMLQWALQATAEELELAAESGDEEYAFLWYH